MRAQIYRLLAIVTLFIAVSTTPTFARFGYVDPNAEPRKLIVELCEDLHRSLISLTQQDRETIAAVADEACVKYNKVRNEGLGVATTCLNMLERLNQPFDEHQRKVELARSYREICMPQ